MAAVCCAACCLPWRKGRKTAQELLEEEVDAICEAANQAPLAILFRPSGQVLCVRPGGDRGHVPGEIDLLVAFGLGACRAKRIKGGGPSTEEVVQTVMHLQRSSVQFGPFTRVAARATNKAELTFPQRPLWSATAAPQSTWRAAKASCPATSSTTAERSAAAWPRPWPRPEEWSCPPTVGWRRSPGTRPALQVLALRWCPDPARLRLPHQLDRALKRLVASVAAVAREVPEPSSRSRG